MKIQKVIFTLCICISFFSTLFAREEPQNPNGSSFINVAVYFKLNKVGPGETFRFQVKSKSGSPVSEAIANESNYLGTVVTARVFLPGDTIIITQLEGPRVCNLLPFYVIPTTAKKNMVVTLSCGEPAPPPPPPPSVPVYFKLNKVGPGENFIFTVSRTKIFVYTNAIVSESNYLTNVATSPIFKPGDTVNITLSLGPRPCNLQPYYVIPTEPGQGLVVNLNCGEPPPPPPPPQPSVPVYFKLNKVGPGENFIFTVSRTKMFVYTKAFVSESNYLTNVATSPVFKPGDTVNITLSQGPRPCNLQPYYVIPTEAGQNLVVNLNCGEPPPPAQPDTLKPVYFKLNKVGPGENFVFNVTSPNRSGFTQAFVTESNYLTNVATTPVFKPGDTVNITQYIGPRTCSFQPYYVIPTVPGQNLVINMNCDIPVAVAPTYYRLGVRITDIDPGWLYKFHVVASWGKEELYVSKKDTIFYSFAGYNYGDTVAVIQRTGPQTLFITPSKTVFGRGDLIFTARASAADTSSYRLGIKVSYMNPADSSKYKFSVKLLNGTMEEIIVTTGATPYYFARNFQQGDTAWVTQLEGPKTVHFTPSFAVFNNADIILLADVGGPPVKTNLAGTFTGPAGSSITIRNEANEELTIAAPANGTSGTGFSFPKKYESGAAYSVSITSAPPNFNVAILPAASGVIPVDSSEFNIICSPAIELVSRSSDNKVFSTFYETVTPVVGGKGADEGRYVAFVSNGTGLDGASGKYRQIFLRDMKTGTTQMISRSASGNEGNGDSFAPSISADGSAVAFESYATNLSTGNDNNAVRDVYVWRAGSGITPVSKGAAGFGNAESYEPTISGDGSMIAFSSSASNLTPEVEGTSTVNVYITDGAGQIQLLTKDIKTQKGAGGTAPSISEDGNKVVFSSFSPNLVNNDNNNLWDIFLWQRGVPDLKRISMTASGGEHDQGNESASRRVMASISGNGNYIVYATSATNMVSGDNNKLQDIFICNADGGEVKRISVAANETEGDGDSPVDQGGRIGISYDGNLICYNTSAYNLGVPKGNIILQHTRTGKIITLPNSIYNNTGRPMISRYGGFVVAGCSDKLDSRFVSSGIFLFFTGPQVSGK